MSVVLVASPHEALRAELSRTLEQAGHQVLTSATGQETLTRLEKDQPAVAIVCTDVEDPPALLLMELLRQAPWARSVKIVLAGPELWDGGEAAARVREARADALIALPCRASTLHSVLRGLLPSSAHATPPAEQKGSLREMVERLADSQDRKDYYELLGVGRDAPAERIKAYFLRRSLLLHPDRHLALKNTPLFDKIVAVYKRMNEAFSVLSDPIRRQQYDEALAFGQLRLAETGGKVRARDPEAGIKDAAARKFFRMGREALEAGNAKAARMHLQLAFSREPGNKLIVELLSQIEGKGPAAGGAGSGPGHPAAAASPSPPLESQAGSPGAPQAAGMAPPKGSRRGPGPDLGEAPAAAGPKADEAGSAPPRPARPPIEAAASPGPAASLEASRAEAEAAPARGKGEPAPGPLQPPAPRVAPAPAPRTPGELDSVPLAVPVGLDAPSPAAAPKGPGAAEPAATLLAGGVTIELDSPDILAAPRPAKLPAIPVPGSLARPAPAPEAQSSDKLRHIVVVAGGCSAWAQERGTSIWEALRRGVEGLRVLKDLCLEREIRHLSLYAQRDDKEEGPGALLEALLDYLMAERASLKEQKIGVNLRGTAFHLPGTMQEKLSTLSAELGAGERLSLYLLLSRESRERVVEALRSLGEAIRTGRLMPDKLDVAAITAAMPRARVPDPEVMIAAVGPWMPGDILLWPMANSLRYHSELNWPDFDRNRLETILDQSVLRMKGKNC